MMKPSLPLWHPARAGVSAFGASSFVQGPVRAAALVCVRDAERKRIKKKFMRGWRSSVNKDQVEARRTAVDPRTLSDPSTGWDQRKRRTGLVAIKVGMTSEYSEYMEWLPLTVLQVVDCQVVQVKKERHNEYEEEKVGLQVGAVDGKWRRLAKAQRGHFFHAGVNPKKVLMEFKISPDAVVPVGTELRAEHFVPGQLLDLTGKTKGKGFQGVMKRWGFSGGPASHGNSASHREPGSTGQHSIPSKVWKGKKMPGRMGNKYRTTKNLLLWKIDTKNNLLYVKGPVPGAPGSYIRVRDAKNKLHSLVPPYPTYMRQPEEVLPEVITANSPEPMWYKKMMARQAAFAEDLSKNTDDNQTAVQVVLAHKEAFPSYDKWKKGLLPPGPNPSKHHSCLSVGEPMEFPWLADTIADYEDPSTAEEDQLQIHYAES